MDNMAGVIMKLQPTSRNIDIVQYLIFVKEVGRLALVEHAGRSTVGIAYCDADAARPAISSLAYIG